MPFDARADVALDAADRAYEEGRIAEAERAYDDALATGSLAPSELARAHARLAVIAALAGDAPRFDRHAAIALAIDPELEPPAELSAELRARFAEMRGDRIEVVLDRADGDLVVSVRGAPEGLARTIEARGQGWERRFPWEGEPIRMSPPASALPIEVHLLDPHGNRVARAGIAPIETHEPVREEAPPRDGGDDLIESPWLWLGVGLVVVGIAIAIGFSASGDRYVLDSPVIR